MDHVDPKCQRRSRRHGKQSKLIFPRMADDSAGLASSLLPSFTFWLRLHALLSLISRHEVEVLLRDAFNDLLEPWTKLKVKGTTSAATIDAECSPFGVLLTLNS